MCQYSLEGFKTREAKEGDTVHSVTDHGGAFTSDPRKRSVYDHQSSSAMVCVLYGQKLTIENLAVRGRLSAMSGMLDKRHVVTLRRSGHSGRYGDVFVFENGMEIESHYVVSPLYVGIKVEHEKGMATVNAAITESIKTMPVGGELEPVSEAGETTKSNADAI